jgi:hypothetical protein
MRHYKTKQNNHWGPQWNVVNSQIPVEVEQFHELPESWQIKCTRQVQNDQEKWWLFIDSDTKRM